MEDRHNPTAVPSPIVPEEKPRSWYYKAANVMLWALPIINATYETAVVAMAVRDMEQEDNSNSFGLLAAISTFAFLQSLVFNGPPTVDGFKETVSICRSRKKPANWPTISKRKEIAAVMLAGTITSFAACTDFFSGYYFIDETPYDYGFANQVNLDGWSTLSTCTGVIAAFTTVFTEGISTYKTTRTQFAGEVIPYANTISKYSVKLLGYPLAIAGIAENLIEAYASMKTKLSPVSDLQKYGVMAISMPKSFSDLFFSGKRGIKAIDEFVGKLSQGCPAGTEVIAFFLAAGAACLVIIPQHSLTTTLLTSPETALPFSPPDIIIKILSWAVTLRSGVLRTQTLYPLFLYLSEAIEAKARATLTQLNDYCFPESTEPLHTAKEPLLDTKQVDTQGDSDISPSSREQKPDSQDIAITIHTEQHQTNQHTKTSYVTNNPHVLFKQNSPKMMTSNQTIQNDGAATTTAPLPSLTPTYQ